MLFTDRRDSVWDFQLLTLLGELCLKATLITSVLSNMPQCLGRSNHPVSARGLLNQFSSTRRSDEIFQDEAESHSLLKARPPLIQQI